MNRTSLTDYDRGWIEALIDGEGSISLIKERRPNFKAGVTYKPRLNIGNKDIRLLEKAKRIIGAGCIVGNKRGMYNLDVSANGNRAFLPKIVLITKEKQRLLLIEALGILSRQTTWNQPRSENELKKLEEIYKEIRKINGRVWNKQD